MNKFNFKKEPMNTKARYQGNPIQAFRVSVEGKNATLIQANKFLDQTMDQLFKQYKPTETKQKIYRTLFKLSDGRWYSSKPFSNAKQDYYPDLTDEQYHVNHSHDLVEFVNITMVDSAR